MAVSYPYTKLSGRLSVGDVVRAVKGKSNPCGQISNDGSKTGLITDITPHGFSINGCGHSFDNENAWLEIVKGAKSHSFMTSVIETFKLLRKSEPEKTFIKAGLMDAETGELTDDGTILFEQFLLGKFGADFKTEVVDAILAEQKRAAKETKDSN